MAQLVEHILGKDEVPSSNLGSSSRKPPTNRSGILVFIELSSCYSRWELRFVASQRSPVRIPRPGGAQSANAKCKMQNAKLRDDCNEVQTVGDDGLACGLGHLGVWQSFRLSFNTLGFATLLGVPINAKCKIETENLIHRHHANPIMLDSARIGNPVAVTLPQKGR